MIMFVAVVVVIVVVVVTHVMLIDCFISVAIV